MRKIIFKVIKWILLALILILAVMVVLELCLQEK